MAEQHKNAPSSDLPTAAGTEVSGAAVATLLGLACAPFGGRFPAELMTSLHGAKAFVATQEGLSTLLAHAGYATAAAPPDDLAHSGHPTFVWTKPRTPFLRLPDGRWYGPDGQPAAAPDLKATMPLLAVTDMQADSGSEPIRLMALLGQYRPQLVKVGLMGLLINSLGLAVPLFSMTIYDRVLPVAATRTLWLLALGIAIVLALDVILRLIRGKVLTAILAQTSAEQDGPLLATLLRQRGTGTRWADQLEMMRLSHSVREQVILHILPTLADIPFVLLFLFTIAMVAPALLPVPLVLLALTLLVQAGVLPRLRTMARQLANAHHHRTQVLLETLRSAPATRLTNRQHEALARWNLESAKLVRAEVRGHFWQGFGQHLTITVAQLSFVCMLIAGAELVIGGTLTVGALVAASLLCSRAITPALHLIDTGTRLQNVRASAGLLKKGLAWPQEPLQVTKATPEVLTSCRGDILLTNVSVKAGGQDTQGILRGINLRVGAGERWALVGSVGAGKSTLLNVLSALVEPSEGDARLDGVSYARMPVSEIRRHVAMVSQNPVFGDVTVRETIAGMAPLDDERMQEALAVSGFGAVLVQQGQGLDMRPGPNAERLSGGQRHMLALAVALYARPRVLLLDEPTSQFDPDAEAAFCARMKPWLEAHKVTLLLVTHRDAVMSLVDYMAVLVQGRIVAGGDKKQVMRQLKQPAKTTKETTDER